MKTHCNIIKDLLPLHMDGILSEESVSLVDEHLTECESCRLLSAQIASKEIAVEEKLDNLKAKNAFRKIRRYSRKVVAVSVTVAVILCMSLTAIITYKTAGWRGLDNMIGLNIDKIISSTEYTRALKKMIAAQEGWDEQKMDFTSQARRFAEDRQNNWTFTRPLQYDGVDYFCVFYAGERFMGRFEIEGYEFATFNHENRMWEFSEGGTSGY